MNKGKLFVKVLLSFAALLVFSSVAMATDFKIAIMQDTMGAARQYKPLLDYFGAKGIDASFVAAKDYSTAAAMFANGEVDAMFSGSGVAGTMIIKGVAGPIVRPVSKDGTSTYWAVVVAPAGSKKFDDSADYFKGKSVAFSPLASSGEFYFHSIPGAPAAAKEIIPAPSHGAAIDLVSRGRADMAIVKNRVWDSEKSKFPGVINVGEDNGENPNNTLIVSNKSDKATIAKIEELLLGIDKDSDFRAKAAMESLGVKGYIKTTAKDFEHTLQLLKDAGVTAAFDFKY